MVDKTLSYLDYLKLLDLFKQYSATPYAADLISSLRPLGAIEEIKLRQSRIEDIIEVIKWDGNVPLSDIPDIRDVLKRTFIKDSILDTGEFLMMSTFLRACDNIARFLKKAHVKGQYIETILENVNPFPHILSKILKTINPDGFIEDTATYELSKIRADLFLFRGKIKKQLERIMERETVNPVLQDFYVSIRNGRYIIPLKPNFNQFLQGIVHDYSHTLKTSFVEPVECVEINNSINMLEKEEKEEEKRVLKELTEYIRNYAGELKTDLDAVAELDLYHSIALFSMKFDCIKPEVGPDEYIDIKNAMNPFIAISKKDRTIPIDIFMDTGKKAMVISGPNAGGKTVALKTIGLLSLMAQTGLFIPASGRPRIPVFKNVFAIIGDEQDISMELSSFTAHMTTIKEIYEHAVGGELILIDEIGGNTEPQEASALSMGVIDAFVEKGCRVVVTTHLNLLKAYGYTNPFAINAATAFDMEKMKPLYKLTYGMAGYSNAISVAININVPERIIEKSYEYLGTQEHMLNELVSALENARKKADEELAELKNTKEELKKRLALVRGKKDEIIKTFEEKYNLRLLELEIELEEIKKEIAKNEKMSIKISKERLTALRNKYVKNPIKKPDDIKIGDYVFVNSMGGSGYVTDIDKGGDMYEVVIGNLRTKVNKFLVSKTLKTKTFKPVRKEAEVIINVQDIEISELNLMGLRVEDALEELDRFIDKAVVRGTSKAKIIHGIGTGRLMNAVKNRLLETKYIKNIERDERNAGITLVELL
ncbi:MAG: Smr/MutS family protein [Proteobacteria bacterium]|nr:Smr/MutS family protein [Pseudomonadota bacterium]